MDVIRAAASWLTCADTVSWLVADRRLQSALDPLLPAKQRQKVGGRGAVPTAVLLALEHLAAHRACAAYAVYTGALYMAERRHVALALESLRRQSIIATRETHSFGVAFAALMACFVLAGRDGHRWSVRAFLGEAHARCLATLQEEAIAFCKPLTDTNLAHSFLLHACVRLQRFDVQQAHRRFARPPLSIVLCNPQHGCARVCCRVCVRQPPLLPLPAAWRRSHVMVGLIVDLQMVKERLDLTRRQFEQAFLRRERLRLVEARERQQIWRSWVWCSGRATRHHPKRSRSEAQCPPRRLGGLSWWEQPPMLLATAKNNDVFRNLRNVTAQVLLRQQAVASAASRQALQRYCDSIAKSARSLQQRSRGRRRGTNNGTQVVRAEGGGMPGVCVRVRQGCRATGQLTLVYAEAADVERVATWLLSVAGNLVIENTDQTTVQGRSG